MNKSSIHQPAREISNFLVGKLDRAGRLCEEGIIAALGHVFPWMDPGTALLDEDITIADELAAVSLYPEALRLRIATKRGTTPCFLM